MRLPGLGLGDHRAASLPGMPASDTDPTFPLPALTWKAAARGAGPRLDTALVLRVMRPEVAGQPLTEGPSCASSSPCAGRALPGTSWEPLAPLGAP